MLKSHWYLSCLAALSTQALAGGNSLQGLPATLAQQEPMTVRVNGLTLQVRTARVDLPPESLADAILEAWRDAGNAGLRFDPDADRTVLGRQSGTVHETVTLLPAADPGATTVVHAENDSRQTPSTVPTPPFQLPRGLKVTRTVEDVSGSKPVKFFFMSSELRPAETAERLRAAVLNARWILTSRRSGIERSAMMTAARAGQEMTIVVADRAGETRVTLEITGHEP